MENPNWNLLRIFAAVAGEGGVTRASEALGLSQPAVSQSLRKLEEALGQPLVQRNARQFELTPFGAEVQAEAASMQAAAGRIIAKAARSRSRLEIAMIPNLPSALLDEALRLFHQRRPETRLRIDILSSMDIIARLRATGRGVGICLLPRPLPDLDCRLLFSTDWSVFCGVEHPLFGREEVTLDELRAEPFVAFSCADSGTGFEPMDSLSRDLGLGRNVIATSTSAEEVRRMIVAGLGLGVLSWTTARAAHEAGLLWPIRITRETLVAHIYLVHAPDCGDAAAAEFAAIVAELQPLYLGRR